MTTRLMRIAKVVFVTVPLAACSFFGINRNTPMPEYTVVHENGKMQIRQYAPMIVAQTIVDGSYHQAQIKGFKRLAGYIFGKNKTNEKISMTSPVQQQTTSQTISMTSPVQMEPSDGHFLMTFMMPSEHTLDTLPTPLDPLVELKTIPAQIKATITYSGFANASKNHVQAEKLTEWLQKQPTYTIISEPIFAGYNPPWTLWFLRRNEMMIVLQKNDE